MRRINATLTDAEWREIVLAIDLRQGELEDARRSTRSLKSAFTKLCTPENVEEPT